MFIIFFYCTLLLHICRFRFSHMNFTILSFSSLLFTSSSPFFMPSQRTLNHNQISFYKSYFTNSFSTILQSFNTQSNFEFKNVKFFHSLSTPVVLSQDLSCRIASTQNPADGINGTFEDKIITANSFSVDNWEDRRAQFIDDCGEVNFTSCIFHDCYAKGQGGGIICFGENERRPLCDHHYYP